MTDGPRLVLASASPRRAELLALLGLRAEILPAEVDERPLPEEAPRPYVERLASAKAEAVSALAPGALVVGGDTVVAHGGRLLGKPVDDDEAVDMLLSLSGRAHEVLSGIAIAAPGGTVHACGWAEVRFRVFDERTARAYVATGEPRDKAGAYGIQGMGAALVEEIRGDYYTIVGFPIGRFLQLLEDAGWRYAFGRLEPLEP